MVQRLLGMREVPGSNPLGGNILCSSSLSEKTINRGPNTPIPTTHVLICEELRWQYYLHFGQNTLFQEIGFCFSFYV